MKNLFPTHSTARAALLLATITLLSVGTTSAAASGPVSAWRFDEPDGQIAFDDGKYGLDARLGATDGPDAADPTRVAGASGGALRFGGGSFARLPDSPALAFETLTVEVVARAPASPGNYRYLVSRGSHGCFAGSYGLYTGSAGGIGMYVYDGSRYVVSAIARPADVWNGEWHHLAGTFDGRVVRVYVDGRPVGEPLELPMRIDYATTTASAAFGRYAGECDLSFLGDLDAVRLWSHALDAGALSGEAQRTLRPADPMPTGPLPGVPAAAAPAILPSGPAPTARPAPTPGAPPRACRLALSHKRIAAGRRAKVRVRVTLRGLPVSSARVVASQHGGQVPLTAGRTGASGRVRLIIRAGRPGRVRISAKLEPSCAPAFLRVARKR